MTTNTEGNQRSVHQAVVHAFETYLAVREAAEIKADPDTLRALARQHVRPSVPEASEAVRAGDVVYGSEAGHAVNVLDIRHRAADPSRAPHIDGRFGVCPACSVANQQRHRQCGEHRTHLGPTEVRRAGQPVGPRPRRQGDGGPVPPGQAAGEPGGQGNHPITA